MECDGSGRVVRMPGTVGRSAQGRSAARGRRTAAPGAFCVLRSAFGVRLASGWPPGTEPADDPRVTAIAEAARALVRQRDEWLAGNGPPDLPLKQRTLTNRSNRRPDWLAHAHAQLDQAVAAAYGWPHDLTDEQILERLLALNLARAAAQGDTPPPAPDTADDEGEEDE